MIIPPLAIIQARLSSTRLPGKMLLTLNGETLIARAWRQASAVFGDENTVVAIPADDKESRLGFELRRINARVFAFEGDESDVLSRFYCAAHHERWHPQSVVVRWTPDDPWKDPDLCRMVVAGRRFPVEQSCEAFTLAMLDFAHDRTKPGDGREHLTYALYPFLPPPPPDDGLPWTIDTEADYTAVRHLILDGVQTYEDRVRRGQA